MDTAGVIRRVQQAVGDSDQVYVFTADLIDYINEGQLEIARETQCFSKTNVAAASTWTTGKTITDLLLIKRITYGTTPLDPLPREAIDSLGYTNLAAGTPEYYYVEGQTLYVFPTPLASDATNITVYYVNSPVELTISSDPLTLPVGLHVDLMHYCIKRAHERNENWRAAEYYTAMYMKGINQRRFESLTRDDSFAQVTPDIEDTYGSI